MKKILIILLITVSTLFSHSGRTNRNGEHKDHINGGCHNHTNKECKKETNINKVFFDPSTTLYFLTLSQKV